MKIFKYTFLSVALLFATQKISAQLTIDESLTGNEAAQLLAGAGVNISNVIVTAADSSWAYYNNVNTELQDSEGLLLTTGKARNAIVQDGVNGTGLPDIINQTECLNCDEFDNAFPGSPLLNNIYVGNTFDATTFQFDIQVQGDSLEFGFTFASEEYEEWVDSPFNDVFGFFISGPGGLNDVNIALVPGTTDAVAINSVNQTVNTQYYYDNRNPLGQNIQYDGFTVDLKAEIGDLIPCETYTLKLIVADRADRLYDSAVFIETINSNYSDIVTSTTGGTPYMIEGCNDGTITFVPNEVLPVDQTIEYSFGGTAEIGVDYTVSPALGTNIPNDPQTITIPANQASVQIDVSPTSDGLLEGDEYIALYVVNQLCTSTIQDSVLFVIKDSLELDIVPPVQEICPGETATLTGVSDTNGDFEFTWSPADVTPSPNDLIVQATPTENTTYTLTSSLALCNAEITAQVNMKEITVDSEVTPVNCSGAAIGEIDITISDIAQPYTVEWTDADGVVISTDEDLTGLEAGNYTLSVTDGEGCTFVEIITVFEENTLVSNLTLSDFNGCNISCFGECDATATVFPSGGEGPYTVTWSESVPPNTLSLADLCPGNYSVTVLDNAGCEITENFTIIEPDELTGAVVSVTEILCNGSSTGEAEVTASGGKTPYAYSWSTNASGTPVLGQGPVLSNLDDGTYFVSVTDANGCTAENQVEVVVQPPPGPIEITLSSPTFPNGFNTTCFDSTDGSIDATVSGGVPGYTYTWTDAANAVVGTSANVSGLPCGIYTLTVIDNNGCDESELINLTCPPQISIDFTVTPNPCNDLTATAGAIDIVPSGGTGMGYTFSWTDSSNTSLGNSQNIANLASDTYTVAVTDSDGCSRSFDIPVTNEDDIDITVDNIQNLSCFESCDGAIDITITGAVGDYTVEWSDLDGVVSTDEDLSGACAGDYFLVITGEDDCQATQSFTLTEPNEIVIDVIDVIDPSCFGQNDGSIEIAISGGEGALSAEWQHDGSSDLTISSLVDGDYTVVVTDAFNNCTASETITLESTTIIDIDVQLSVYDGGFNVSCNGAMDGWANAAASGGNPDFDNLPFGYFYDWSSLPAGNDPSLPNQQNLVGGVIYGLIVTDTAGCQGEILIPFLEPDVVESLTDTVYVSCVGDMDATLDPNISGGSGNYTSYNWVAGDLGANASDASILTNLGPGEFTLEVEDSNGCTATEDFVVAEPEELVINIDDITQEDCFGTSNASITVSGQGGTEPYSFTWVDQNNTTYTGTNLTSLPSGTYTVTLEDANLCTTEEVIELNSDEVFQLDLNVTAPGTGDYTLACLGDTNGSAVANITGGIPNYTYTWTDLGTSTVIGSAMNISDLAAGNYNVQVEDFSGCVLDEDFTITEPTTEFITSGTITSQISCNGSCTGEIELTASGGDPDYTYLWVYNDGELAFDEVGTELCAGFYEILVTDANGCDSLMNFTINEPDSIVVDATLSMYECSFNVSCAGAADATIDVSISGGVPNLFDPAYTLEWTGDIGTNPIDTTSLEDLGAGTYVLNVTDAVDCEITQIVTITEPEPLMVDVSVTNLTCFDDDDGEIIATPTGGCAPYDYAWSNTFDNTASQEDLTPGTYTVDVTDANGCMTNGEGTITEPDLLEASATSTPTTCGLTDGCIETTVTGGTMPYNFNWDNGADNVEDPCNLDSITYTLNLTDANGCVFTLPVEVDGSIGIDYDSAVTDVTCFGGTDGCVNITILEANGIVDLQWFDSDGASTNNPCPSGAGSFFVNMTDEAGCTDSANFTINQPDSIEIDLTALVYPNEYNLTGFQSGDGEIDAETSGGTAPYSYSWSSGQTQPDISGLEAGEYILTVTDDAGCENSNSITLEEPRELDIPSGYTPNADGFNDFFVVQGIDQYDNVEITVFNRWGNSVYTNANYDNTWNGRNDNGDELADGTYYVIAVATRNGEAVELNSFIDLRR